MKEQLTLLHRAKPSSPSVKFNAFEAPIITNKPNGKKSKPIFQIKFLKKENKDCTNIHGLNI